ncbi:MAG: alpha/beta hydrolase family protein [Bacteroidota bacterium]|jgi:hypothetical protein|nr:alpha/beta hydrolase family protein [Bacteroidota bacterium]HHU97323.1 hypothetical protein [Petrimonas sp.]
MKRINNFLAGLSLISLTVLPCGCGNQAKQGNEDTTTEGKGSRRKMERVAEFHAPDYFNELYNNAEMRYSFKGDNKEEFTAWQKEFRPKLMEKLGLTTIARQLEGFVPKAEKIDSEDLGYARRERWVIWTEPNVPLPFIIMFPTEEREQYPLMISPHGHHKNTEVYAGV